MPTRSLPVETRRDVPWHVPQRAPVCDQVAVRIVSQDQTPELSLATLVDKGQGEHTLRLGSRLGKHRVVGIGYDRRRMSPSVYLSSERGLCQAMLFEGPERNQVRGSSTRKRVARPHSDSTLIRVDRSAVDSILERSFELTRGVRIVPDVQNGVTLGMRVYGVGPESLLAALGLQNGDRVERINGVPMTTPEAALSLYANLRYAQSFEIGLNRANRPFKLEIRVD